MKQEAQLEATKYQNNLLIKMLGFYIFNADHVEDSTFSKLNKIYLKKII